MEVIRIGKKLTMPEKKQAAPQAHTPPPKEPEHTSWMGTLALQFVDVLNKPIEMLSVAINVNGKETKHKTDGNGKIPDVEVDAKDTPIQVTVEKISGGWKKITEFTAWSEAMYVRLRSPKVMLHSEMRVHEGPTQTSKTQKPVPQSNGPLSDFKGASDFCSGWMGDADEETYRNLLSAAIEIASNIKIKEGAYWNAGSLGIRYNIPSRGPLNPPAHWPQYRLVPTRHRKPAFLSKMKDILDPVTQEKYDEEEVFEKRPCIWTLVERLPSA